MIKKYCLMLKRRKGSAAIILSLIVSGSILSTIFLSQQSVDSFLSAELQNVEDWEYNFAAKNGLILGAYFISNNLVLCKEGGWNGHGALCKWNDSSSKTLSEFTGLSDNAAVKTKNGKKVLSIKAKVDGEIISNPLSDGSDIKYELTFDLVNWKDASIAKLIGEIPKSICRNSSDMTINNSGSCALKDQVRCKDSSDNDMPNTICEQISTMDQDYTIVLISVTTPLGGSAQRTLHAGLRRPLAVPLIEVQEPGPVCQLSCAAVNSATALAECRGPFTPGASDGISTLRVKVTNQGPGAMYALSLMRKDTFIADGTTIVRHLDGLFEDVNKEVLFPGESFFFQDYVVCEDTFSVSVNIQAVQSAARRGVVSTSSSVNVHAQPFMTMSYEIGSVQDTVGSCMAVDVGTGRLKLVDGTDATSCPSEYSPGEPCGAGVGKCYYSHVEPRRTVSFLTDRDTGGHHISTKHHKLNVVITSYIPPH